MFDNWTLKKKRAVIGFICFGIGYGIIAWQNWIIAIGLFFVNWSINAESKLDKM